jgi:hypothetical protein
MTKRRVRRPNGELVQYTAVVDRQRRPEVGGVAARPRRWYFETAPIDSPRARASSRTLKLLVCSPISCFNFDMEILSFGIARARLPCMPANSCVIY